MWLAEIYSTGKELPQTKENAVTAFSWFYIAARNGNAHAHEMLKLMPKVLTSEQIERAEQFAIPFLEKYQNTCFGSE